MSSEIQFGDVEQNEPQRAVRPDRDAHFCITTVGDVDPENLPIFVDLDVMRDMEAHAHTNTRVELGGVMLGKQCLDREGNPFVMVTDSLRARHYEATRGSFKFTHETWSQITSERNQFHPDLEMVGWYHTHPGWTVFLSPMDLFICNNFFNRDLDVALVIDPCNDDRGWFQWDENHKTLRTGGFFLTTIRYREDELNYFASLYNHEPTMNSDPRYSGYHISAPATEGNAMDPRKPWFDLVMVSMLLMQLFLMVFMAMKLTESTPDEMAAKSSEDRQPALVVDNQIENQSLKMALSTLASATGQEEITEKMVLIEQDRLRLNESLKGQFARIKVLDQERMALQSGLDAQDKEVKALANKVVSLEDELEKASNSKKDSTTEKDETDAEHQPQHYGLGWLIGTGLAGVLLGLAGALLFKRNEIEPNIEVGEKRSDLKFDASETMKEE